MKLNATTVVLLILCSVAWLVRCTDVPTNGPTPPDFQSEFRFLNADKELSDISMSFDLGPAVSGIAFKETNAHQTYPSGNRVGVLEGDTLRIAFTSEQRSTVMILPKTGDFREFIKLIERRIFDPVAVASVDVTLPINDSTGTHVADTTFENIEVGRLRIVHGVPDSVVNITIQGQNTELADGEVIVNSVELADVEYRTIGSYTTLPVGNYTLTVASSADGSVLATSQITLGAKRQTSVLVDSNTGVEVVNLEDN